MSDPTHYNQTPKRKAKFITPPNTLKEKVGSGGLKEEILDIAQAMLEHNKTDFVPLAEMYLSSLTNSLDNARVKPPETTEGKENLINEMLHPAVQLKGNGGMFHYPLITVVADKLIQFLEAIEEPDSEVCEIIFAFHTSMKAVVSGRVQGDGGSYGKDLISALTDACYRYFEKNQDNVKEFPGTQDTAR